MCAFGDRKALEGATQPINRIGRHQHALQDVVRDRLILDGVAAGRERQRAERGKRSERSGAETHARRVAARRLS